MIPFPLYLAVRYFKPSRSVLSVVTIISMLGVLLGVAILVIVLSVMGGFDEMWRQKILSFKPHLTIVNRSGEIIEDEENICQKIERIAGVSGVAPVIEMRVLARSNNKIAAPVLIGIDENRARSISRIPEYILRDGGNFDITENKIVLGIDLASQMGVGVGDKVLLYSPRSMYSKDEFTLPEEVIISGIFDMGMRDFDAGFVFCSLETARELAGMEKGAHAIYVMTEDPLKFDKFTLTIADMLGNKYSVLSWKDIDKLLFSALSHEKTLMFILLLFITIVAIFCVTNTLIVMGVQKTQEIGLLKALGFSPYRIMIAFILHGWMQCFVGSLCGLITGLLVLNNLKSIVKSLFYMKIEVFPKGIYGLSEIPWRISYNEISFVIVTVIFFCTLASLIPAWRAARLDPARALRHE